MIMRRRDFLRSCVAALGAVMLGGFARSAKSAFTPSNCKLVVFGSDALRHDTSVWMWQNGAPALSQLNKPICSLSGGSSWTQPGWASIWFGLPAFFSGAYCNGTDRYNMSNGRPICLGAPKDLHLFARLMDMYNDIYTVWVAGKDSYGVGGYKENLPHWQVYDRIVNQASLGEYHADDGEKSDDDVYQLAENALQEAVQHENYLAFIHFHNPDNKGHATEDYAEYVTSALYVDSLIAQLMSLLPDDTNIVYCSDHGFNFMSLGEVENSHVYAPKGMVGTNAPTNGLTHVCQNSVGRLIYRLGGGDPDEIVAPHGTYSLYGQDLV